MPTARGRRMTFRDSKFPESRESSSYATSFTLYHSLSNDLHGVFMSITSTRVHPLNIFYAWN
jgi:hypothetical protein